MDNLKLKKICGIGSMAVIFVCIIVTAFVFGRDEVKIKTHNPSETQKTTTTTSSSVLTTTDEEKNTQTNPETLATTTTSPSSTSTSSQTTTTTTTKAEETTTTTAAKKPVKTTTTTTTTVTTTTTPKATQSQPQNGKLDIRTSVSNSWEENGKTCTQIDIVITNNTGSPVNTFDIVVNLGQAFEIVNSWNADFSSEGANLRARKTLDYNVENGCEFNAGLIVKADNKISL